MLFLYGTRATKIKEGKLQGNTVCSYCNNKNSFNYTTYSKYIHLFFIPLLPIKKITIFECNHCKKSYSENMIPSHLKHAFQKEKEINPSKKPLWQGLGCLLIIILFVIPILSSLILAMLNSSNS